MKVNFVLFLFLLMFCDLQAQNNLTSPYSRFGLGNLSNVVHPEFSSLGGAAISMNGLLTINNYNPASYSFIKQQRFIMSVGVNSKYLSIANNNKVNHSFDAGLSNLNFAFSLNEKWAASFGILPYSQVAYSFSQSDSSYINGQTPQEVNYLYSGSGGLSRFYLGSSFLLDKSLSFGVNVSYLFGQLNNNKKVDFLNDDFLNVKSQESLNIGGLYYDFGAQFNRKIDNYNVKLGVVLSNSNSVNATLNKLSERYYLDFDTEVIIDTTENSQLNKGVITMPNNIGFGLNIKSNNLSLFLDFSQKDWSQFSSFGLSDSLSSSEKISVGLEYIPDYRDINTYSKIIRYRFGYQYNSTYLDFNNHNIIEQKLCFGVGLPFLKTGSFLNLSMEMGKRGTLDYNLIEENFVNILVGFKFNDVWFLKRKYD
tara:strand:+ start:79 stop:1347 length:1269 start_codon:yes stop_codon:yes gene_type:complete